MPIDIGLVLEGQDAIDFEEYMKNPTYSEAAINCMKEALRMKEEEDFSFCLKKLVTRSRIFHLLKVICALKNEIDDLRAENEKLRKKLGEFN